jgi:Pyruvate phosphate dikinase, AMP/ATP-binding domain
MTAEAPAAGAEVPLVLALDDPGAVPGVVGGKGASFGRLVRAGVRVPAGFHVTTAAYLDFLSGGGLREELLAAASLVDASDGSDAVTSEAAAARIGELFAAQAVGSTSPPRSPAQNLRDRPGPHNRGRSVPSEPMPRRDPGTHAAAAGEKDQAKSGSVRYDDFGI